MRMTRRAVTMRSPAAATASAAEYPLGKGAPDRIEATTGHSAATQMSINAPSIHSHFMRRVGAS